MTKTQKFKERKLNSFLKKLARSVDTSTTSAVDNELNLMVKFTLDKILESANIISTEYAKQKTETVKPSLLQAAFFTSLHGELKESATDAGAEAALAYQKAKKSGGIRKMKKSAARAAEADAAAAEVEVTA
jgi:hypothetical protein